MNFLHVFLFLSSVSLISSKGLREEFSWKRINYEWPGGQPGAAGSGDSIAFPGSTNTNYYKKKTPTTTSRPDESSNEQQYIYQNNIPMGANVWNQKLFITVPRRRMGIPSTLNYVWINSTQRQNVPLIPYPDWETNTLPKSGSNDSQHFVSVYRVAVDSCDRLWFVDTGIIETLGNPRQVQPTAIVIMDLKTDRVIQRHVLDSAHLRPTSGLASVTVDITNNQCGDAFAYIPDLGGYGLIVYSLRQDKAWRVTHNFFFLEPLAGEFKIGGHMFQWNDGIFSIALSGVKSDGYRDAYFHSMAGFNEYRVSTKVLKNESTATRSYHGEDFEIVGNRGMLSQSSSSALHQPRGILFLALVNQNALACWNIATPISDMSIVHKDNKKMIYPSDVKISGDKVIVLTNTMPVFLYGNLNYDEINFRVWVETVDMAVKGTKCDKRPNTTY